MRKVVLLAAFAVLSCFQRLKAQVVISNGGDPQTLTLNRGGKDTNHEIGNGHGPHSESHVNNVYAYLSDGMLYLDACELPATMISVSIEDDITTVTTFMGGMTAAIDVTGLEPGMYYFCLTIGLDQYEGTLDIE